MIKKFFDKYAIYILIAVLFCITAFYGFSQVKKSFRVTPALSNDGMFPTTVNRHYEQTFVSPNDVLSGVTVSFYTRGTICDDAIQLDLIDVETGQSMQTWQRRTGDFQSDEPEVFLLEHPVEQAKGKVYVTDLKVTLGEKDPHISVFVSGERPDYFGTMDLDDLYKEDIYLQMGICSPKVNGGHVLMLCVAMLLGLCGAYFLWKNSSIEKISLWLIIGFGLLYFVAIPMLQVPDEKGHYYRSFEISQGDMLTPKGHLNDGESILPGNLIPAQMEDVEQINYQVIKDNRKEEILPDQKAGYANPTQALYSPISYGPQALGCLIGRMLSNRTVFIFYMGRLISCLVCAFLSFMAIKWTPLGKRFFLLIICMPMYLQQMVSLSSDALINAAALFLVALLLKCMVKEEPVTFWEKICLIVICVVIAFCKVVYLPLCFLLWLLPGERLGQNRKNGILWKVAVSALCTICNLGWLVVGFSYMYEFRAGVNSGEQIKFILTHPFQYINVLAHTVGVKLIDWLGTMVGAKLCILNVYTCIPLLLIYLIVMIWELASWDGKEKNPLQKWQRYCMVLLFFIIIGITLTSLYVQWTAVRNRIIEGFQGRYFIPVLPLLLCAIPKRKWMVTGQNVQRIEMLSIVAINICALFSIVTFYK